MNTLSKRLAFDAVLTALLIIEMFIQFTGVFAHEAIGCAFFCGLAVHLICERKWLSAVVRKRSFAHAHAVKLAIAIALAVVTVALGASSLAISTILHDAGINLLTFVPLAAWSTIHTASAYALCAATVVHLVAHWSLVARAVRIPYDPSRRAAIGTGVGLVAGGCAMAIGVAGAQAVNATSLFSGAAASASAASAQSTASAQPAPTTAVSFAGEASDAGADGQATAAEAASIGSEAGSSADGGASTASATGSASAAAGSSPSDGASSGSSSETGSDSSSAQVTGTCPICPKNCPLSSPRCNRPYEAGLISA